MARGGGWLNSHNFLDLRATPTVEILNGETGGEFSHQSFSCDSVGTPRRQRGKSGQSVTPNCTTGPITVNYERLALRNLRI